MRGCFQTLLEVEFFPSVFPAHAGVFPSPRRIRLSTGVFPAHAGVFLGHALRRDWAPSLPRACGGVSVNGVHGGCPLASSPRMRGCFLNLSCGLWVTHSLPRACGGVSNSKALTVHKSQSSPRMRGCFLRSLWRKDSRPVFPAHAGVFPRRTTPPPPPCLPRACGGVSLP